MDAKDLKRVTKDEEKVMEYEYHHKPTTPSVTFNGKNIYGPAKEELPPKQNLNPVEKLTDSIMHFALIIMFIIMIIGFGLIIYLTINNPALMMILLIAWSVMILSCIYPLCKISRHIERYHSMNRGY